MDKSVLLYQIIEIVVFCIPVGALIWKAAKQSGRIEDMENHIKEIEKELISQKNENSQTIKEIKDAINQINVSYAKIETSLQFIEKSIKEK